LWVSISVFKILTLMGMGILLFRQTPGFDIGSRHLQTP